MPNTGLSKEELEGRVRRERSSLAMYKRHRGKKLGEYLFQVHGLYSAKGAVVSRIGTRHGCAQSNCKINCWVMYWMLQLMLQLLVVNAFRGSICCTLSVYIYQAVCLACHSQNDER